MAGALNDAGNHPPARALYLAYGSNLSRRQMARRCPSAIAGQRDLETPIEGAREHGLPAAHSRAPERLRAGPD